MASFCPNCGTKLEPSWNVCGTCGTKIEQAPALSTPQTSYSTPSYQQPTYSTPTYQTTGTLGKGGDSPGMGIAGMILGIIGLPFCMMFVPSILGIIFGEIGKGKDRGSGMGLAGLITGIIGIVIGILFWFSFASMMYMRSFMSPFYYY